MRLAAAPLPRCRFTVEQAYDGRGLEDYRCVNKSFFDWPETFDLRDRLPPVKDLSQGQRPGRTRA